MDIMNTWCKLTGSMTSNTTPKSDYYLYFGRDSPMQPATDYQDVAGSGNGQTVQDTCRIEHTLTDSRQERLPGNTKSSSWRGDKMTTGCHQFLIYANILFNILLFITGAGILGLGVYILGSDYGAKQMSELLGNDLYVIAAYVLVVSGAVLVLISICGCCGALRESKFMLGFFIFALSVLVLVLITAAVIVFVFRQKMEGDVIHSMEDVLIQQYGVDLEQKSENRMVTDVWNWVQREMNCCGVTGGVNSTTSWAIYRHTEWYKGFETGKPYVPQSCCKTDGDINQCTGITDFNGPPAVRPPLTANMDTNTELYTVGCYDELVHYIQIHAVIIGVSSIAAVIIMMFGLFFALFLCRKIDVEYYSY